MDVGDAIATEEMSSESDSEEGNDANDANAGADVAVAEDSGTGADASAEEDSEFDSEQSDDANDSNAEVDDVGSDDEDKAILVATDAEGETFVIEDAGVDVDASMGDSDGEGILVYDDDAKVDIGSNVMAFAGSMVVGDTKADAAVAEDAMIGFDAGTKEV